jgi:predicted glycosyltransferase
MLLPDEAADPVRMAKALIGLPDCAPPSRAAQGLDLGGLDKITDRVADLLDRRSHARFTLVEGAS